MKKLFDAANRYIETSDWKIIAVLKFCLISLGMMVGMQIRPEHKKTVFFGALGVFATVIALALFQLGVFLIGSVRASLLSTFEPLTGVVLGVAVLGETLSMRTVSGMALILLAVVLLVLPPKEQIQNRSA